VGRGASFLLNVPPDRRGLIHGSDTASLNDLGKALRATFRTNLLSNAKLRASSVRHKSYGPEAVVDGNRNSFWASAESVTTPELGAEWQRPVKFNVIRLREEIRLGQRIEGFQLDIRDSQGWQPIAQGTSVGSCRLIRLPSEQTANKIRLRITQCPVCPVLSAGTSHSNFIP
jgi:alpha-L-fucosidase